MDYDQSYFKGKTAVVTGAASGIGLALAEELLLSGAAKVVMADNDAPHLHEHAMRLEAQYPGQVKEILCDVRVEAQVQSLIAQATEWFGGRLDLVFNNAGSVITKWFDDLTNDDWKEMFDVLFYGPLYGTRAAVAVMKKQGGGQIINTISGTTFTPFAKWSAYATAKAALTAFCQSVRSEYWDDNIKISAATPGTVATNIFGSFGIPPIAQTPKQAATRMLDGVVHNYQIIFGDDYDVKGAGASYAVERQERKDQYLLRVARERREGKNTV